MSTTKSSKRVANQLDAELVEEVRKIREGSRKVLSPTAERYLRCLVNPEAKPSAVPTLVGGYGGRSRVDRYFAKGTFVCGTGNVGFISISPAPYGDPSSGAVRDTSPISNNTTTGYIGMATNNSYTLAGFPQEGAAIAAGLDLVKLANSPWGLRAATDAYGNMQYRCVSCIIEVFPESSFSTQNGELTLLEAPGHVGVFNTSTTSPYSQVSDHPNSRTIRGTQTGSQSEKIVLNWHPRAYAAGSNITDFVYCAPAAVVTTGINRLGVLTVAASAAAGTIFHYKVTVVYELRGRDVSGMKRHPVDSRGMDLVHNIIASKELSGYVGNPTHVEESYLHQAWTWAKHWARTEGVKAGKQLLNGAAHAGMRALGGFL